MDRLTRIDVSPARWQRRIHELVHEKSNLQQRIAELEQRLEAQREVVCNLQQQNAKLRNRIKELEG